MTDDHTLEREDVAIKHVTDALCEDFGGEHSVEEVVQAVEHAHESYADCRVREFVPTMVERDVRQAFTAE